MRVTAAALADRETTLRTREQAVAKTAEHAAAILQRDELAADIARDMPAAIRTLTSLAKRIRESDDRLEGTGELSAEAMARGWAGNFYVNGVPVHRLGALKLYMPDGQARAWEMASSGWRYPGLKLPAADAHSPSAKA